MKVKLFLKEAYILKHFYFAQSGLRIETEITEYEPQYIYILKFTILLFSHWILSI